MKTVNKSVLIWYSPLEMYALVTDVMRYPEFLPWCDHAKVVEQVDNTVTAELGLSFGGIHQVFTTKNTHTEGSRVELRLVKGPFSRLQGQWLFHALGDGTQRACKVELLLEYGFENATLSKLVGPVFDKVAGSLVDAFVKRAQQVYG